MSVVLVLLVLAIAIALFATEVVPVEVTSLTVVALLAALGVLTPEQAFAGFANETVIFIFALLAMTEGLVSTGAMHRVGAWLAQLSAFGRHGFMFGLLSVVAVVSAFVSNTVTTAAFLLPTIHAARAAGLRRREVLMPLAFASMLGGLTFLYGTSTNLVVSARLEQLELGRIGLVELSPVGIPVALVGLAFLVLLAPRMLRPRHSLKSKSKSKRESGDPAEGEARDFVSEAQVGLKLAGRTIEGFALTTGLRVSTVLRGDEVLRPPEAQSLAEGDVLVLRGRRRDLLRLRHTAGVTLAPVTSPRRLAARSRGGPRRGQMLAEGLVLPHSPLAGRTLRSVALTERHGARVLALFRHPSLTRRSDDRQRRLGDYVLQPGDLLLLAGPRDRLEALAHEPVLLRFTNMDVLQRPSRVRMLLALGIFAGGALVVGSVGLLPLAVAGLVGVVLMIFTGCLDAGVAFRIDWRIVLLIGSMMALGVAVDESGTGALLGSLIASSAEWGGPRLVLLLLMIATALLSIPMSNQAAALVLLPVALAAAEGMGVNPRTLAMGVVFAASCSFLTPLEPSALLVFGPGRYRFGDFLKVGGPMSALLLLVLAALVPVVWPF